MVGSMIVNTPTLGPVTTSWACLNCPLTIFGKSFGMDLVCLAFRNIDFILGMNWLEFNRGILNCHDKTVSFPDFDASDKLFVSAKQVDDSVKDEAEVFMLLASMKVGKKVVIGELPMLCNFSEVFLDDISDFSPEREVEFAIDLVPSTSSVSMDPYRIFASELSELKKKIEEFLEKKFVQMSVFPWGASMLLVKKKDGSMRLYVNYR
ncbi:uncharacterized protein LOC127137794 [Lathyrus oleraceus]|uniref:uncharacterized protein LOC127137794 n=1 Tax=Pisum sativum TaxID=3888 RepID=UPI0021CE90DD|nr:uncharacterized protein LOC127137794 [Pisum sativum]